MIHEIRSGLHVCQIGRDFIGLDLDRNRYSLFRGGVALRLAHFFDDAASDAEIEWLFHAGLIENHLAAESISSPRLSAPTKELRCRKSWTASPLVTIEAMAAQVLARRRVASQPLSRILAGLRAEDRGGRIPGPDDCQAVALAFARARRYLSQTDQCLSCSVGMVRLLARRGWRAHLVIGVALPFTAHCWVQAGEVVLSDSRDRVRSYTPILIV